MTRNCSVWFRIEKDSKSQESRKQYVGNNEKLSDTQASQVEDYSHDKKHHYREVNFMWKNRKIILEIRVNERLVWNTKYSKKFWESKD